MVLFGELVIPSSRALWDDEDEFEQFTEGSQTIHWIGSTACPAEITNLLIIETKKLSQLARSCLYKEIRPICRTFVPAVSIYRLKEDNYMVICEEEKDIIPGEITEKLIPWIENAEKITAITSSCAAMFQKNNSEEMPISFIRSLRTGNVDNILAPKLEAPNLVTGISAGVMTYSQIIGKSASLYICYSDSLPLDSTTAEPILNLLEKLKIPTDNKFKFQPGFKSDSNLYM